MPSKNTIKKFAPESFYHVYNRGVEKKDIFGDDADKLYFLKLFARYLDPESTQTDQNDLPYRKFNLNVEPLCYCIMDNHYHLLVWINKDTTAISELMRSIGTAYSMYYNRKYQRVGPLFQSRFKASRIKNDEHLMHMIDYIHQNPLDSETYMYSSLHEYRIQDFSRWLQPKRILNKVRP